MGRKEKNQQTAEAPKPEAVKGPAEPAKKPEKEEKGKGKGGKKK